VRYEWCVLLNAMILCVWLHAAFLRFGLWSAVCRVGPASRCVTGTLAGVFRLAVKEVGGEGIFNVVVEREDGTVAE